MEGRERDHRYQKRCMSGGMTRFNIWDASFTSSFALNGSQQLTLRGHGHDIVFTLCNHPLFVPYLRGLVTCHFAQLEPVCAIQTTQLAERVLHLTRE